jgi:hypothetical protein
MSEGISLSGVFEEASNLWDLAVDGVSGYFNNRAFESGVEEMSDVPVVYLDPKELPKFEEPEEKTMKTMNEAYNAYREELRAALREQLEDQMPGATDAVIQRYSEFHKTEIDEAGVALKLMGGSPSAVSDIMIDGSTEVCLVTKPNDQWDSTSDVIKRFVGLKMGARVILNTDVSDRDTLNWIGKHEGEHCNKLEDSKGPLNRLKEELRADNGAVGHSDSEVNEFMLDLRHLSNSTGDPIHATGTSVVSGEEANEATILAAINYRTIMDTAVNDDIDHPIWDDPELEALIAPELLEANPDAYFEIVNMNADEMIEIALNEYNSDPSLENTAEVIYVQHVVEYSQNYEASYRQKVLGENFSDPEPIQLLPREVEDEFYTTLKEMREGELEEAAADETIVISEAELGPGPEADKPDITREEVDKDFSGDDATYVGDMDLVKEVADAGIAVNPNLVPDDTQAPMPSEPSLGQQTPQLA